MANQPFDRVEAKFTPEPNTGCWLWHGARNGDGYGVVRWGGKASLAHRVVFNFLRGDAVELDHLCRVHECVNPDHLEPVTHLENCRRGQVGQRNREKTVCSKGHPLSGDNVRTYVRNGWACRACRRCHAELTLRRYHERKEKSDG